ncbi:hypothetical protein C8T65DRAFT_184749 [Cerioporus squamosus]|nr:hypothetical protein C8T65DRAFT_184749 [Cerioporus squamosus]
MLFERAFGELQHVTTTLVADVRQAGADMETHLRHSHMIQEKQLEIVKAAEDVSSALSEMVVNAHVGMQELNGTISEVKDSLKGVYHQDWAATLRMWFQEAALQFLRSHSRIYHRDCIRTHALYSSSWSTPLSSLQRTVQRASCACRPSFFLADGQYGCGSNLLLRV